jgi:heme oxygenase
MGNYWPMEKNTVARQSQNPASPNNHPIAKQLAANDRELLHQFERVSKSIGISDGNLIAFLGTRENNESKIYPIIESQQLEHQLIGVSTLKLPRQIEQKLANEGWKINSQKQFVSVPQPNGARKTIPIGMLNCQFVGRETF